jgi:hypothetical protein
MNMSTRAEIDAFFAQRPKKVSDTIDVSLAPQMAWLDYVGQQSQSL